MAVRNLWRHFERNLCSTGSIFIARGNERFVVWIGNEILFHLFFCFAAKGYLKKLEEDPEAVICLGDSAYHRSSVKGEMGIGRPVPQRKDGVQQKVIISKFFFVLS